MEMNYVETVGNCDIYEHDGLFCVEGGCCHTTLEQARVEAQAITNRPTPPG